MGRAVAAAWAACWSGDALAALAGVPQASMACICLSASAIGLLAPRLSSQTHMFGSKSSTEAPQAGLFTGELSPTWPPSMSYERVQLVLEVCFLRQMALVRPLLIMLEANEAEHELLSDAS